MKTIKAIIAVGMVAATVAANAQITLSQVPSKFVLGGGFSTLSATPTYVNGPGATGSANLSISTPTAVALGTINTWWFTAVDPTADIGNLSYNVKLGGVTSTSKFFATLTAMDVSGGGVGKILGTLQVANTKIEGSSFYTTATNTLTFSFDPLTLHTPDLTHDVEYKLNLTVTNIAPTPEPASCATFAFGAAGLLIHRRRRSK
jgi:hypothetical protein